MSIKYDKKKDKLYIQCDFYRCKKTIYSEKKDPHFIETINKAKRKGWQVDNETPAIDYCKEHKEY